MEILTITTLLSLLAMYAKEKRDQKDKSAADFLDFMVQRDFGWIKDNIAENSASLLQIDELLQGGLEGLNAKLDVIENSVIALTRHSTKSISPIAQISRLKITILTGNRGALVLGSLHFFHPDTLILWGLSGLGRFF